MLDIRTCNKPRDWFWPIGLDDRALTGVVCKEEKRCAPAPRPRAPRPPARMRVCVCVWAIALPRHAVGCF